jgi:hypothetical protein
MKTQKQSRVDSLEKRVAAMTNVIQQLIQEVTNLRTLSFGTLETIKQMPGYNEALEKLKEKTTETNNEKKLDLDVE